MPNPLVHLSFSSIKEYSRCPFAFKIGYIDDVKLFKGNAFTVFGKSIHTLCEQLLKNNELSNLNELFDKEFSKELLELSEKELEEKEELIVQMFNQGKEIIPYILPAFGEYFGNDYEIVGIEDDLMEDISYFDTDIKFKGFVDIVVKTKDGKIHIVDAKSCSWGWDSRKKADKLVTYQLTLYKIFYAQKYNIPLEDIETHFGLLKRTAKKERVELFRVTSGEKKTNNCKEFLEKTIKNIEAGKFWKNYKECVGCSLNNTIYCKNKIIGV